MADIGMFLRESRKKCNLSLKAVYNQCGITDSRLSRIERGQVKSPDPSELKNLAHLYGISPLLLFVMAGYLDEQDTQSYQFVFRDADLLTNAEAENIQTQIDLFTKGRKK